MAGSVLTQADYVKRLGEGCRDCGAPRAVQATYCVPCRDRRRKAHRAATYKTAPSYARRNHRQRARHHGVEYEPFDPREVFARDGWMCGICHEPIDPALQYPDHRSVSLDHIIPLSRGGGHTRDNTQPAHFICNSTKSDGQLGG